MKWTPITEEGKKIYGEGEHDADDAEQFGKYMGGKENYLEYQHIRDCLFNQDETCENELEAHIAYMGFKAARERATARENNADRFATMVRRIRYEVEDEMWKTRKYTDEDDNALKFYNLLTSVTEQLKKIDDELCEF